MAPPGAAAFAYHQMKKNQSHSSSSPAPRQSYSSPYEVENFKRASEAVHSNYETALSALKYDVRNFDSLSLSLKSDPKFLCKIIQTTRIKPSALSESSLKDRAIANAFVSKDGQHLKSLTDWQDDEEIVGIALKKLGGIESIIDVFKNISPRLQKTSSIVMKVFNQCRWGGGVVRMFELLVSTNNPLKKDPEIIKFGIEKDGTGRVFSLVDLEFQRDKNYVLLALRAIGSDEKGRILDKYSHYTMRLFSSLYDPLKQDKDVVFAALKSSPYEIFRLMSPDLKSQKVFALEALRHLWLPRRKKEEIFRDIPPILQMDDQILEALFAHDSPKELCCENEKGFEDSCVDTYCCCLCNTISDRFNKMMYRKRAVQQVSNASPERPLSCEMGAPLLNRGE